MSEKPLTRIQREGHYLGGLFHQYTIFVFGLRAFFDLAILVACYFVVFRLTRRMAVFGECFWNCLIETEATRCPFSVDTAVALTLLGVVSIAVSAALTIGTKRKLFLRSTLVTALAVVAALVGGFYYGASPVLVLLFIPVAFFAMYAGYRLGLIVRRQSRSRKSKSQKEG